MYITTLVPLGARALYHAIFKHKWHIIGITGSLALILVVIQSGILTKTSSKTELTLNQTQPTTLPAGLYSAWLANRQNEGGATYDIQTNNTNPAVLEAANPEHKFEAQFTTNGISIDGMQLSPSQLGAANQPPLSLQSSVAPKSTGNRVDYERAAGIQEWYINGPLGLEHGFTLQQPLSPQPGNINEPLQLELNLSGIQHAQLGSNADSVEIMLASGQKLSYSQLYVYDAADKTFPARFKLSPSATTSAYKLTLEVNGLESGVTYPLTIDPMLTPAQKLTASDGAADDLFGWSVALSANGTTALISSRSKNSYRGAVYVYTRSETGVDFSETQKLLSSDIAPSDLFGYSVALSDDGNTALIGAIGKRIGSNDYQGAAYVFIRSGVGANFSESQRLIASDGAASNHFGDAVALSGDGNTALISADSKTIGANFGQGAVYVFTRSGGGTNFSELQRLTASDGAYNDRFGYAVDLSSDGTTALISANWKKIGSNDSQGAAYIFTRGSVEANFIELQRLTASDGAKNDDFGDSVALSGDGNTALIGARSKDIGSATNQGAAYLFTRIGSGTNFSETQRLTAINGRYDDLFGWSVTLSSDGNTALIGAFSNSDFYQGAAYVFKRNEAEVNFTQTQKLTASDAGYGDYFGAAVALSADGTTGVVSTYYKTVNGKDKQGAAYVYEPGAIVTVTASASSVVYGENVIVTATVTFPYNTPLNGEATFYVNNSPVNTQTLSASGVITYIISGLAIGNHSIHARYNGGSYRPASSSPANVTVTKIPTSVTVTSSINPAALGSSVTFTATVTPATATGTVALRFDRSSNVSLSIVDGVVTYTTTLPGGDNFVQAEYIGNATFTGSESSKYLQVVNRIVTNLILSSSANPAVVGESLIFTATLVPPGGSGEVTFKSNGAVTALSYIANGVATYTTSSLPIGIYNMTASYAGNVSYTASTSQTYTQQIIAACSPQVITNPSDDGQATTCGTFSYALAHATSGTIYFGLPDGGNTVTFTGGLSPTLKPGVIIDGGATGIILNGNGVAGDGLKLEGGNQLTNLTIRNFGGHELLVGSSSAVNRLFKVKVQS